MADQTGAAVDSLLGLLSGAIKDEARLLGGVQGDMQFIKDEMDSMNGFLLHLNRTESEHDDQLRAWMKQVRDIADIAQDCIEAYMNDIAPLQEPGFWAFLRNLPKFIRTIPSRHRLATKIQELRVRVRDVGERRQRYDISIGNPAPKRQKRPTGQGGKEEAKREEFLDALSGPQRDIVEDGSLGNIVDIDKAIAMLLPRQRAADEGTIRAIVDGCSGDTARQMFLRALYAHPHGTQKELKDLMNKKTEEAEEEELDEAVMTFCYSMLPTHYKRSLQYLTAFQKEDYISRTSMVRRWLAEGLVAREEEGSLEDAAKHCFHELMFRGFIHRHQMGASGKAKSCQMDKATWKFVINISKSENFVGGDLLPDHLENQVAIREIVRKQKLLQQPPPASDSGRASMITACCTLGAATAAPDVLKRKDPLVDMLSGIRLKNPLYRLNVLDLGGCKGLRRRHLKALSKVPLLKYLSLRDTDIDPVLPKEINSLKKLETLDIRQTDVQAMDNIFLPKLKHLLAGRPNGVSPTADGSPVESSLTTVRIPCKIAAMRHMEILSHVQVNDGDTDRLDLPAEANVRKLGVLLTGSQSTTISRLLRTVSKLSGSLRSLSIWIRTPDHNPLAHPGLNMESTQPRPNLLESLHINGVLGNDGLPTWCYNHKTISKVTLCGTNLPVQSLGTLGKLEKLCCLRLRYNSFIDTKLSFNDAGEFRNLRFLVMEDTRITNITVGPSSVPRLERITWWCSTNTSTDVTSLSTFLDGIDELPSLKFVVLNPGHHIRSFQTKKSEVIDAGMMLVNVQ